MIFDINDSGIGHFMIDGKNIFDHPIKNDTKTCDNIRKITTDQRDDYTTACLLDYSYFNKHYKKIAIDLSKQQGLGVNPKAMKN